MDKARQLSSFADKDFQSNADFRQAFIEAMKNEPNCDVWYHLLPFSTFRLAVLFLGIIMPLHWNKSRN